jgi:predicted DNA-binding transcriptional regulator YafY
MTVSSRAPFSPSRLSPSALSACFRRARCASRGSFRRALAPDARTYVFHPSQTVTDLPDGGVLVEFTAGGLREMCWHLFTWGGEVEIVRPKRLLAMMREELARHGLNL